MILENLLAPDELARAQENFLRYCPSWDEFRRAPGQYPHICDAGGRSFMLNGPFVGDGLNQVSTHPDLVAFARAAIGTDDVLLEQSHLRAEYSIAGDFEQHLHLDFGSHSLTYPREDAPYPILSCIVYYSDVSPESGPTHVVSSQVTRRLWDNPFNGRTGAGRSPFGGGNLRWQLTREEFPEVYEREVPVLVKAGGAMIYSLSTHHRAGRMTGQGARFSHTVSYRAGEHRFAGFEGWSFLAPEDGMQRFLTDATPEERALIGFPLPGDAFWNERTLRGVAARYPEMDMTPYRRASGGGSRA